MKIGYIYQTKCIIKNEAIVFKMKNASFFIYNIFFEMLVILNKKQVSMLVFFFNMPCFYKFTGRKIYQ